MTYYIDLLSIQTPKHLRKGLENRTRFDCGNFEINIFETFQSSTKVQIQYDGLSISGMIRGKKIVHSNANESFEFLPGTTLILPEGKKIFADFPEASEKNPVQCATLLIPQKELEKQLQFLNEIYSDEKEDWEFDLSHYHFQNNSILVRAFNEFLVLMERKEQNPALNDLMLKTFLVRMMEAQKAHIEELHHLHYNQQLYLIKNHIKENLSQPITMESLMEIGNCSKSTVHRMFENFCGKTPGEFILHERMAVARNLLLHPDKNISDVSYLSGFSSVSYFSKQFKLHHNCTPGDFVKRFRAI